LQSRIYPEGMGPKPNPPPEREKRKGINETAFFAENEKTKVNADIFASPKPGKTDLQEVDISDKPPTFRYFHAPIKGHPDYKDGVVTDDTIEPSQVIVSEGRVVGIEVDPEVAHQLNQEKQTTANLCQVFPKTRSKVYNNQRHVLHHVFLVI